ncbi:hypothetical protein JCM10450v2_007222 [Rhodotorula kratochvilovae]
MDPFPDEDPPARASTVRSARSDPALVWAGGARLESHHSPSPNPSVVSLEPDGSVVPDPPSFINAPASLADSRARERREALEREECARWAREEDRLKAEDLQSELAHGFVGGDAEPEVLRRKMEQARAEACRYEELYARRTGSIPPQVKVDQAFVPARRATSSTPVHLSVKLKVKEPKPWTGKFEYQERETWARSVTLYLGSHGVGLDTPIGELSTPEIFYAIRSMFSPESGADGIAPQIWFDSVNARTPFISLGAVLNAVKEHWTDDAAAEKAFSAYRNARQGALRARDFGAKIDALATACMDRFISDVDRKSTFLVGLHSNVLEFVKTQVAARKALGIGEPSFDDVVNIAAQTDSLPSLRRADKPATSSSSPSSRKASGTDAPSRQASSSSSSPANKPPSNWLKAAREWQQKYPVGSKNDWHDSKAPPTSGDMRCYNCGEVGRHWSKACTKSRKDPDVVILAVFHKLAVGKSPSLSSPHAASLPGTSGLDAVTEESSSSESGKEDGA